MNLPSKIALALVVLAGCGGDSPVSNPEVDEAVLPGWTVIQAPNGFGDVASTCVGNLRLFIGKDDTYASSSIIVVPDWECRS